MTAEPFYAPTAHQHLDTKRWCEAWPCAYNQELIIKGVGERESALEYAARLRDIEWSEALLIDRNNRRERAILNQSSELARALDALPQSGDQP